MDVRWSFLSVVIISAALLCEACGSAGRKTGGVPETDRVLTENSELPLPEVPSSMTDTLKRIEFVLLHFWDEMDWRNGSLIGSDAFMEQNLVNFYSVAAVADSAVAAKAFSAMLAGAAVNPVAVDRIADITGRYLYTPDSPMYDAELFAVAIDALLPVVRMPDHREILEARHREIMRNRVGGRATDFRLRLRDGREASLYGLLSGADTTLLMFYSPDCEVCAATERLLRDDEAVARAVGEGRLRIVAVDPFGTDYGRWKENADSLPQTWTVGRTADTSLDENDVYVIRSTPALYLLDGSGKVLRKDFDAGSLKVYY